MRNSALAGLFAMVIIFIAPSSTTSAQEAADRTQKPQNPSIALNEFMTPDSELKPESALKKSISLADEQELQAEEPAQDPAEKPAKAQPIKHTVKEGESLSKIAKKHKTTWQRLFYKNTSIEDPDKLVVGVKLIIPAEDEKLKKRNIPAPEPVVVAASTTTRITTTSSSRTVARGSSSGNLYGYGYCTWYVKNMRPDLPNNLGNAITWASRAAAQGIPTGSTPRVGAVGQQGNHVVYVERVNSDGTVLVSEMNWSGWNVRNTRTAPASNFTYIY